MRREDSEDYGVTFFPLTEAHNDIAVQVCQRGNKSPAKTEVRGVRTYLPHRIHNDQRGDAIGCVQASSHGSLTVFDGVVEQIIQHLLYVVLVGVYLRLRR